MRSIAMIAMLGACAFHAPSSGTDGSDAPNGEAGPSGDAGTGDAGEPRDAAMADASTTTTTPVFLAAASAARAQNAGVTYEIDIPAGTSRFLLVSVQLGANCPADVAPSVASVTYDGLAMTRVTTMLGTPCGAVTTRSEQWGLVAPHGGPHDVKVTLSANVKSVHSSALAFAGVDQAMPIRATANANGTGMSSSVTVTSAMNDLVVNTVGHGNRVTAPGAGQMQRTLRNTSNTLNNSASSTAAGAASVTMTWTFGANDEWQTISSSIRPE